MTQRRIEGIVIHWTASGKDTTVNQIRGWHKKQGWRDIGYHRVILYPNEKLINIEWFDLVKQGRQLDNDLFFTASEEGAHAKGFNKNHIGIVVVGNTNYKIHDLQKEALINTCDIFLKRYQLEKKDIKLHREVNPTACPGDEIANLITNYKKGVLA